MAKQGPNIDTSVCYEQYSRGLERDLRELSEHDAVNPISVDRSLNRIREAEEMVVKAQECLAHAVLEERKAWNLD